MFKNPAFRKLLIVAQILLKNCVNEVGISKIKFIDD